VRVGTGYAFLMSRLATRSQMTADAYLAWERQQATKHEFFHGEVFAMAGASPRHNALCGNVVTSLNRALRPRGCAVLTVSVVCGGIQLEASDVLLNPTILVEVLSASTEQYDRGLKWEGYQRIASLEDYVLVSQLEARIEPYRRASDGSWTYRAAGRGERVTLSTGAELVVDEIFAGTLELPGD
jgi:Uma2 family endonuclease